jgi:ABC-2 type transport system permease protein
VAFAFARWLPSLPVTKLSKGLPVILLALLLFWQLFPLMTLSSGWSIELSKLLVYPIRKRTMFAIEVLLRLTNSPESIIVLCGVTVGLARNPAVPLVAATLLLLYIPFNLLLCAGVRGLVNRMLSRRRLKELALLFFLCISVLPSLAVNTGLGKRLEPYLIKIAQAPGAPWSAFASLSLGHAPFVSLTVSLMWVVSVCAWAGREFNRMISAETSSFAASFARESSKEGEESRPNLLFRLPARLFRDPLAALIEKEMLILSRSPRFRLIFAMACLFSVVVFFPLAFGRARSSMLANNFLPFVNAYGLLIVGETLLWNCFGFDRRAAQLYFVSPVPIATVFKAKNIVAACAIAVMTTVIAVLSALVRRSTSVEDVASTFLMMAVLTIFFVSFGNLTSVWLPRPIDPNQAMKNQNNAKASAVLLLCTILLAMPLGLALVARWAFESNWPFFGILIADIVGGLIVYSVTMEAAVGSAERNREKILSLLSQDSRPIES